MVNEYKKSKLIYMYISEAHRRNHREKGKERKLTIGGDCQHTSFLLILHITADMFPFLDFLLILHITADMFPFLESWRVSTKYRRVSVLENTVWSIAPHFARLNSKFESCRRSQRKNRRTYSQMEDTR